MATLSYYIPVSDIETLFPSADLASFVIAVSEMARVWPVKTLELLFLLLNEGRAPSQNCADMNINYHQKRQYITSSSALVLCREALTPAWPTCAGGGWKTRRSFKHWPGQFTAGVLKSYNCSAVARDKKNQPKGLWRAEESNPGCNQSC